MLPLGCFPHLGERRGHPPGCSRESELPEKEDFNKAHSTQYQILSH